MCPPPRHPKSKRHRTNIRSDGTHAVPGRDLGLSHDIPTLSPCEESPRPRTGPFYRRDAMRSRTLPVKNGSGTGVSNWRLSVSLWPAPGAGTTPSFLSPTPRVSWLRGSHLRDVSVLPFMKHPDIPEVGGGRGTWLGGISSHSFLGSGLAEHGLWPMGSRWAWRRPDWHRPWGFI